MTVINNKEKVKRKNNKNNANKKHFKYLSSICLTSLSLAITSQTFINASSGVKQHNYSVVTTQNSSNPSLQHGKQSSADIGDVVQQVNLNDLPYFLFNKTVTNTTCVEAFGKFLGPEGNSVKKYIFTYKQGKKTSQGIEFTGNTRETITYKNETEALKSELSDKGCYQACPNLYKLRNEVGISPEEDIKTVKHTKTIANQFCRNGDKYKLEEIYNFYDLKDNLAKLSSNDKKIEALPYLNKALCDSLHSKVVERKYTGNCDSFIANNKNDFTAYTNEICHGDGHSIVCEAPSRDRIDITIDGIGVKYPSDRFLTLGERNFLETLGKVRTGEIRRVTLNINTLDMPLTLLFIKDYDTANAILLGDGQGTGLLKDGRDSLEFNNSIRSSYNLMNYKNLPSSCQHLVVATGDQRTKYLRGLEDKNMQCVRVENGNLVRIPDAYYMLRRKAGENPDTSVLGSKKSSIDVTNDFRNGWIPMFVFPLLGDETTAQQKVRMTFTFSR